MESFLKIIENLKISRMFVSCDLTLDYSTLPKEVIDASIAIIE